MNAVNALFNSQPAFRTMAENLAACKGKTQEELFFMRFGFAMPTSKPSKKEVKLLKLKVKTLVDAGFSKEAAKAALIKKPAKAKKAKAVVEAVAVSETGSVVDRAKTLAKGLAANLEAMVSLGLEAETLPVEQREEVANSIMGAMANLTALYGVADGAEFEEAKNTMMKKAAEAKLPEFAEANVTSTVSFGDEPTPTAAPAEAPQNAMQLAMNKANSPQRKAKPTIKPV